MRKCTSIVHVGPCLVGTILALSYAAAAASIPTQLRQGTTFPRTGASLSHGDESNDGSSVLTTGRLLSSTRSLLHTEGTPHAHPDAHTHPGLAPHGPHDADEPGHIHEAHSHAAAPAHAHADDEPGHNHTDCHTHDGLDPHKHGADGEHDAGDEQVACDEACTPSTLTGFDCMEPLLGGNVIFHYKTFQTGDTAATMAIESPSDAGWAALGFGSSMIGSTAVIATTTAAAGGVGVFTLGDFSAAAITEVQGAVDASAGRRLSDAGPAFTITDASVERAGGRLVARFSRAYDDSFRGDAPVPVIVAYHSSQAMLASPHDGRTNVDVSLTGGGVTPSTDNTPRLRRIHAALMLISWGILIPIGVIMAATLRTVGPKSMWFQLHRATQGLALVVASAGFFLAIACFDSLPKGDSHKTLGIVVMVLGWLQPLNAIIRPHPPQDGEKRSILRIVWQFVHRAIGWAAISLSITTIYRGIAHAETYEGLTENYDTYFRGYTAALVILLATFLGLLVMHIMRTRKLCKDNDGKYVKSKPASEMAHVDRHPIDSMRPDSP